MKVSSLNNTNRNTQIESKIQMEIGNLIDSNEVCFNSNRL